MRHLVSIILLILISSCTTNNIEVQEERQMSGIYNMAYDLLESGLYPEAANEFLEVERQYPYSSWSERAIIMAAYSYFKDHKFNSTITQCNRYISLFPSGEYIAYSHYLIGQSYYLQIPNLGRDQNFSWKALKQFNLIMERYPESDYADDARFKRDLTLDHIAGDEMEVGRYYLKKNLFPAAINRFKKVIENYQTTSHIEEALARYSEAYLSMGIYTEAQTAAAILGFNYPNGKWYKYTYNQLEKGGLQPSKDNDSWLNKVWNP